MITRMINVLVIGFKVGYGSRHLKKTLKYDEGNDHVHINAFDHYV